MECNFEGICSGKEEKNGDRGWCTNVSGPKNTTDGTSQTTFREYRIEGTTVRFSQVKFAGIKAAWLWGGRQIDDDFSDPKGLSRDGVYGNACF
jgi:hypothetical protein